MNVALSKAYAATLNEGYRQKAISNIVFIEGRLYQNHQWHHTYKNKARIPAFLDDLAYLAMAYIHLQEITGESKYLLKAKELVELIIEEFGDEAQTMFYYTKAGQQDVILRKKEIYDGAVPSGNSIMAFNLRYMAKVLDKAEWEERADAMLLSLRSIITKYPTSFGFWAQQAFDTVKGINEVAIVGVDAPAMLKEVLLNFIPSRILQSSLTDDENYPLLRNRLQRNTLIYLCKNYVCGQPLNSVEDLVRIVQPV
jgi:uncharacterized protein YyaL (SSP411 family)